MKRNILVIIAAITLSFAIYAQSEKIILKIINVNNGGSEAFLDIPLKSGETVDVISSGLNAGNITAVTTLTELEAGLTSIGISGGNPPTISSFDCTNGASCGTVTTSSTTVTTTIGEDAVYCYEYLGATQVNAVTALFVTSTSYTTSSGGVYKIVCGNNFGETESQVTINLTAPPVVSISASPTSVNSGDSSTVTWSIANNPTTCTFTGDWPSGNQTNVSPTFYNSPITLTNITSAKNLSMSCTNAAGTSPQQTGNIGLNGGANSAWTQCTSGSTANRILGGAEDRTVKANGTPNAVSYDGLFEQWQASGTFPWPGDPGDNIHLSLTKDKYIAAKFTTNSLDYDAQFLLAQTGNLQGTNPTKWTMSFSTCPGEFNNPVGPKCTTSGGTLYWSTKAVPGIANWFCKLEKNTTYYLNIVHSDGKDASGNPEGNNFATSDCLSPQGYCGILAQYGGFE